MIPPKSATTKASGLELQMRGGHESHGSVWFRVHSHGWASSKDKFSGEVPIGFLSNFKGVLATIRGVPLQMDGIHIRMRAASMILFV